ncbi:unnamed protein product [Larinioides sclopetarius]|uniref:PiggyBac transposable element-derived protein domain-containing protein n=1 Tax=Larinioides sclopetarius TaxID=280406 RepID=A0AAV1ZLU2_9ARAC
MPKFGSGAKQAKGESEFLQNRNGTLATRWKDSKKVIVLSNCHLPDITTVERTQRDGKKEKTECPVAIADYNKIMGGVDLSDQKIPYNKKLNNVVRSIRKYYKKEQETIISGKVLTQEIRHVYSNIRSCIIFQKRGSVSTMSLLIGMSLSTSDSIPWNISNVYIRYTKHIMPHDYLVTFSPLTVNVILPDSGLCGVSAESAFSCSYAIYLLFCLILPPLAVIILNGILLSSRVCKRGKTVVTPKRNISSGNSNILNADKEVFSIVIFMSFLIVFSFPRSVIDVAVMCGNLKDLLPVITFSVYFFDSLLDILLPVICLGMHPRSRTLLSQAFRKRRESTSPDLDMVSLNL